jgi:hypothetical protein
MNKIILPSIIIFIVVCFFNYSYSEKNTDNDDLGYFGYATLIGEEQDVSDKFWENPKEFINSNKRDQNNGSNNKCILFALNVRGMGLKARFCYNWEPISYSVKINKINKLTRNVDYIFSAVSGFTMKNSNSNIEYITESYSILKNGQCLQWGKKSNGRCIISQCKGDTSNMQNTKFIHNPDSCSTPIIVYKWIKYIESIMGKNKIKYYDSKFITEDKRVIEVIKEYENSIESFRFKEIDLRR